MLNFFKRLLGVNTDNNKPELNLLKQLPFQISDLPVQQPEIIQQQQPEIVQPQQQPEIVQPQQQPKIVQQQPKIVQQQPEIVQPQVELRRSKRYLLRKGRQIPQIQPKKIKSKSKKIKSKNYTSFDLTEETLSIHELQYSNNFGLYDDIFFYIFDHVHDFKNIKSIRLPSTFNKTFLIACLDYKEYHNRLCNNNTELVVPKKVKNLYSTISIELKKENG